MENVSLGYISLMNAPILNVYGNKADCHVITAKKTRVFPPERNRQHLLGHFLVSEPSEPSISEMSFRRYLRHSKLLGKWR